ncbi:MAG: hypothetical protein ACRCYO_11540 [Bacteroidia bacterium]
MTIPFMIGWMAFNIVWLFWKRPFGKRYFFFHSKNQTLVADNLRNRYVWKSGKIEK